MHRGKKQKRQAEHNAGIDASAVAEDTPLVRGQASSSGGTRVANDDGVSVPTGIIQLRRLKRSRETDDTGAAYQLPTVQVEISDG